jgi:DNA-binding PadR family transcriptional regulator
MDAAAVFGEADMRTRGSDPDYTQSMYGLLAILSRGPMSGYDVRKVLDGREMYYWRESSGNIYPMMRQLHQDGLLDRTDSYVKRKKRVLYSLTDKGRRELENWLREPASLTRFRVELLMKLRFGTGLGAEHLLVQLDDYRGKLLLQLEEAEEILSEVRASDDSLENDVRSISLTRFIMEMEALVEWCDRSGKLLACRLKSETFQSRARILRPRPFLDARTYHGTARFDPGSIPVERETDLRKPFRITCR